MPIHGRNDDAQARSGANLQHSYGVCDLHWLEPDPAKKAAADNVPIPMTPPKPPKGERDLSYRSRTAERLARAKHGLSPTRNEPRQQPRASEQRSATIDDVPRQKGLNEQLNSETRDAQIARRRAEHSSSETKAELDAAKKREQ